MRFLLGQLLLGSVPVNMSFCSLKANAIAGALAPAPSARSRPRVISVLAVADAKQFHPQGSM